MKVVTLTGREDIEKISTIGGLIVFDQKIYKLTTGHGFIAPRRNINSSSSSSYSSDSSTSGSESMVFENTDISRKGTEHKVISSNEESHLLHPWTRLDLESLACFCGQHKTLAAVDSALKPSNADFALVDMELSHSSYLINTYELLPGKPWSFMPIIEATSDIRSS